MPARPAGLTPPAPVGARVPAAPPGPSSPSTRSADGRDGRRLGTGAVLALTVCATGGPLALAALSVPHLVIDAPSSGGAGVLLGAAAFVPLLRIWLGFARTEASGGGLSAFVTAAAGRRAGLAHAGVWALSYVLYLVSTTADIVHDLLPDVFPGIRPYQRALDLAVPAALAAVLLAGRRAVVVVTAVVAGGQLAVLGVLDAVTLGHASPLGAVTLTGSTPVLGHAAGQSSLLLVCSSLPLFLGGEIRPDRPVLRRGIVAGVAVTVAGVVAAVSPLAADPGLLRAAVPGVSVARVLSGSGPATVVGVGVAVSIGGVMLVEYVALTRLAGWATGVSARRVTVVIAGGLVAAAIVGWADPERVYEVLLRPSLVALWLSQLPVALLYPRFVARRDGSGRPLLGAVSWAVPAAALCSYGLWSSITVPLS